jgi:hypothetical protein
MNTLQTAQDHVAEMQLILLQLAGYDGQRTDIINNGKRLGNSPHEISEMLQNISDVERDLINQYWKHSRLQAESFRAFQVRNAKPIDFSMKPYPFANGKNDVQPTCNRELHKLKSN